MAGSDRPERPHLRLVPANGESAQPDAETTAGEQADAAALLRHAAARAADQPFFLAAALRRYCEVSGADEQALAATLGCAPAALTRLALCRAPDVTSARFADDVQRIAAYAGVRPGALVQLLRRVQATDALRRAPAGSLELLAARDRDSEDARDADDPEDEA